jgi:hypothetical protein
MENSRELRDYQGYDHSSPQERATSRHREPEGQELEARLAVELYLQDRHRLKQIEASDQATIATVSFHHQACHTEQSMTGHSP